MSRYVLPVHIGSMSRRGLLALPMARAFRRDHPAGAADGFERGIIAQAIVDHALTPPLSVGLARVILRPGTVARAETPGGVRILSIESGALEVNTATSDDMRQFLSTGVGLTGASRATRDFVLQAGMAMPFGAIGIASLRNAGRRSVVLLDAAVYSEEPRPMARAFTSDDGLSFQLLAHASLAAIPPVPVAVTLERLLLHPGAALPASLSAGCAVIYLESGGIALTSLTGDVAQARAAAAAPYALPGALKAMAPGQLQPVTAGGVISLALDAAARIENADARPASFLMLALRAMP